jgi:hypothetical protein
MDLGLEDLDDPNRPLWGARKLLMVGDGSVNTNTALAGVTRQTGSVVRKVLLIEHTAIVLWVRT